MPAIAPQTITGQLTPPSLLSARFLVSAVVGIVLASVLIGVPTDVLPNPWFTRMTPIRVFDYLFWVTNSVLTGVLLATYLLPRRTQSNVATASAGTGLLTVFAVGCPICNKLVVSLLGISGALNYFAPIQPLLGIAGLATASIAIGVRLRGARGACAVVPASRSVRDGGIQGTEADDHLDDPGPSTQGLGEESGPRM